MLIRVLAGLLMAGGLTFGVIGTTQAQDFSHRFPTPVHQSAPELDPSTIGSGLMILVGGVLLLNERRRNKR
jgi:hypothetical protein